MESKTKELVKAGHELVVLLGNQHGMIDAASLVQRLTAQLDITAVVLREKSKVCDQLAAEHAALRDAADFATAPDMWIEQHDGMLDYRYSEWYVDVLKRAMETPATDAWQREQMARGVEAAIECARNVVAQEFQYKDFDTAQRVCCSFPESDLVGKVEMVEWMADFAAQLRKGEAV
ncbi:eae-like domain protein [Pseudescherichia sp.]|uniref:eae-like domain protein n=1 Tax=Pseudescherichia sp. TaxID=2055881 RepID=UPI0028ACC4D1|nr:eae-like domain protein [Pseudescherichia sp.]